MYPFLATHLIGKGTQGHNPSVILPKNHACDLHKKLGELHGSETMVRRREKFLPLTVFILQTFPPAESTGRIKKEFRMYGKKYTVCIRALQEYQRAKNSRKNEII
jgi:hypothetical protein